MLWWKVALLKEYNIEIEIFARWCCAEEQFPAFRQQLCHDIVELFWMELMNASRPSASNKMHFATDGVLLGERELFPGPCCVSMRVFGMCFYRAVQQSSEMILITDKENNADEDQATLSMRCALSAGLFVKESSFNGGGGGVSTTA
ncbi:hypothetical protein T03_15348 [Trichinella britovi]|uniref:Uncharacterized protein n=1 Tax=Trichinella britovi TaxID=45882 RepID=A0A0V1CIH4_TRIBR|nr:hypothetical protein T03_15348 [Trichinella britovi]